MSGAKLAARPNVARPTRAARHQRRWLGDSFIIAAACGLAAALAVWRIGARNLWLDEGVSVALATTSLRSSLAASLAGETNMTLYHLLLRVWLSASRSEAWARGLSVLALVATIPILFRLACRLFDRQTATIAVLLLATNGFALAYGREARSYTLLLLLSVTSTYLFVRALEQPTWLVWLGWGAVNGLALYAHFFAAFTIGVQLVAVMARRPDWRWLAGLTLTGVLAAPLVLILASHLGDNPLTLPAPPPSSLLVALKKFSGGEEGLWALLLIEFSLAAVALISRRSWPTLLAAGLLVGPLLGSYAISVTLTPIFHSRYMMAALPGLLLLTAAGISSLSAHRVRIAVTGLTLALSLGGLGWLYAPPQEPTWRQLAAYISTHTQPGDGIAFFHSGTQTLFAYYAGPTKPASLHPRLPPGENVFDRYPTILLPLKAADAHSAVAGRRRVWVTISHHLSQQRQLGVFRDALAEEGLQLELALGPPNIQVQLFSRR